MRKEISILLILILNSCFIESENGISVEIKNNSDTPVTNVEFTTSENLEVIRFDKIEPNQTVIEFLSMNKNQSDGAYSLTFTRTNGQKEFSTGGYYSNGGSLDRWVKYEVEADTTSVEFSGTR
jgi:hypothetical protein